MQSGKGVEFDHPYRLLVEDPDSDNSEITNTEGYFSKMILANGEKTA